MKPLTFILATAVILFSCSKNPDLVTYDAHLKTTKATQHYSPYSATYFPKAFHWVQTITDSCTGAIVEIDSYIDAVNVTVIKDGVTKYGWKYTANFKAFGSDGTSYSVRFLENESGVIYWDSGNEQYDMKAKTLFTSNHSSFTAISTIHFEYNPSEGINIYLTDFSSEWTCKSGSAN